MAENVTREPGKPWGHTPEEWAELAAIRAEVEVHRNGIEITLGPMKGVHPDRLEDALTIARLWATLGEPRVSPCPECSQTIAPAINTGALMYKPCKACQDGVDS